MCRQIRNYFCSRLVGFLAQIERAQRTLEAQDLASLALREQRVGEKTAGNMADVQLEQFIDLDPGFDWLMRCDRVGFPPGGIAHTHVHQGPGIRYTVKGEIIMNSDLFEPGRRMFT